MNQDIGKSYSSKNTKTKLSITYNKIRSQTKLLAKKLTLDDQYVQSMPNASPKKVAFSSHPRAISGVLIEISFTLRTVGSSVGSD